MNGFCPMKQQKDFNLKETEGFDTARVPFLACIVFLVKLLLGKCRNKTTIIITGDRLQFLKKTLNRLCLEM